MHQLLFKPLMNEVFKHFLRKFVVVFFDDIMVYSPSLKLHLKHLEQVLMILRNNQLYAKLSKYYFAQNKIDYLGYIIRQEGVSADIRKVKCMLNWPTPTTIKRLIGFLGLTRYYKKFVQNYGLITKPLTDLPKKSNFKWSPIVNDAFLELKKAMTITPILAMPSFSQTFTLETDA